MQTTFQNLIFKFHVNSPRNSSKNSSSDFSRNAQKNFPKMCSCKSNATIFIATIVFKVYYKIYTRDFFTDSSMVLLLGCLPVVTRLALADRSKVLPRKYLKVYSSCFEEIRSSIFAGNPIKIPHTVSTPIFQLFFESFSC